MSIASMKKSYQILFLNARTFSGVFIAPVNDYVRSIINMAHGMGLKVTAEGVETKAQVNLLQSWQCDEMQGFFFSKPLPADEITKILGGKQHRLPAPKEAALP